jgi:hypothetical protein
MRFPALQVGQRTISVFGAFMAKTAIHSFQMFGFKVSLIGGK